MIGVVALLHGTLQLHGQTKPTVNVDAQGVGLHGYDPVAYFTEGKAVKGDPKFSASYGGASYEFKSAENKAAFEKEPSKYAPQFGGYCAMAMTMGKLEDADPNFFLVHDLKVACAAQREGSHDVHERSLRKSPEG
jgi:YHS domain-containing protein